MYFSAVLGFPHSTTYATQLLVLHPLMFFVLVAPLPIRLLLFSFQALIVHVPFVSLAEPAPVNFILTLIPVVIVLVVRIINAPLFTSLMLFLFVPLMIVLRCGDGKSAKWRHQCRGDKD